MKHKSLIILCFLVAMLVTACSSKDECPCGSDCVCESRIVATTVVDGGCPGTVAPDRADISVKIPTVKRLSIGEAVTLQVKISNLEYEEYAELRTEADGFRISDKSANKSDNILTRSFPDVGEVMLLYDCLTLTPVSVADKSGRISFTVSVSSADTEKRESNLEVYYAANGDYIAYSAISEECAKHILHGESVCESCICDNTCECRAERLSATTVPAIPLDAWESPTDNAADVTVNIPTAEKLPVGDSFEIEVLINKRSASDTAKLSVSADGFYIINQRAEFAENILESNYTDLTDTEELRSVIALKLLEPENSSGVIKISFTMTAEDDGKSEYLQEIEIYYASSQGYIAFSVLSESAAKASLK